MFKSIILTHHLQIQKVYSPGPNDKTNKNFKNIFFSLWKRFFSGATARVFQHNNRLQESA